MQAAPQHVAESIQDEPYFPDGNIVLSALSSSHQKTCLFRVHTFMLSHHSPVFAGMFSLPPHPEVNETHDGVAVVRMPDDAEELRDLLRALYDQRTLPLDRKDGKLAVRVRGALSMATKYQVDTIRTTIVGRLEEDWPCSLADWFKFRAKYRHIEELIDDGLLEEENDQFESLPEPISAIYIAATYNVPSILPAAFYLLSLTNIENEWDDSTPGACWSRPHAKWSSLNARDYRRVLLGQQNIFRKILGLYVLMPSPCNTVVCHTSEKDLFSLRAVTERYNDANHRSRPDIISVLLALYEELPNEELCWRCQCSYGERLRQYMQTVWDQLPLDFQLPIPDES